MDYQNQIMKAFVFSLLLVISSTCFSQVKEVTYYFDSDLNIVKKSKAIAKGIGSEINGLFEVKVYDKKDNHLILIVHYTDAGMTEMTGPFTSYYSNGTMENQANYAINRLPFLQRSNEKSLKKLVVRSACQINC